MEEGKTLVNETGTPGKMTFLQNVVLTVKVLAVLGAIGMAIWGIKLWKGME